jgi:hypothetical protein
MTLEEILSLIEENELGRDVFMHLFRDAYFVADQLTTDDCAEGFEGILKGKDDLTRDRLKKAVKPQRFTGRVFKFRKKFSGGKNSFNPKVFILKGMEEGVERWEEIDGNLFVDLKAMTNEDHVRTTFNDGEVWDIEIKTDRRRERMFTTIAKHCYGVEV